MMRKRLKRQIDIPLDIIYHILLRLPVKTLCRLQCVSKSWCSLISDSHFRKYHSCLSQQSPLFLKMDGNQNYAPVPFITYTNDGSFLREFSSNIASKFGRIIQSTLPLPLVCLTSYSSFSIWLCNPSTEQIIILPERPDDDFQISVGFGFAASTNEFKVVIFFSLQQFDPEPHCEVFTVGTNGGWREARKNPPPYLPRYDSHPPFLHGALHLLPNEDLPVQDDHYIATFDVDTEEFRAIPLPEIYFREARSEEATESVEFLQLVGLRGSLCLALDYANTKKILEIWFLKGYHGGNWVKQYNLDLSSLSYTWVYPSAVSSCGHILLNVAVKEGTQTQLRWYDTEKNSLAKENDISCEATYYVESFLSLESR